MKITKTIFKCDFCGSEIEDGQHATSSEDYNYSLGTMSFFVWYGGQYKITHCCKLCNEKLFTFLFNAGMLNNAEKVE